MVDAQLAGLKSLFDVESDTELAVALGVDRSTIAQWRRRGQMPPKYRVLGAEAVALEAERGRLYEAGRRAARSLVYRDPAYHLWTAAVLAALPPEAFASVAGEASEERGLRLERLVAELFQRCLSYSQDHLGKVRPEGGTDYVELVAALRATVPR